MTGSCLCGSARFELEGSGPPMELCHCSRCKKAYGSAFAVTFYVKASGFRWTAGEHVVTIYDAPVRTEPPPYRHVFCGTCGSPLPIEFAAFGVVEIPAGIVDGDPGRRPGRHIFTALKAPWFEIADGLPRYEREVPRSDHPVAVLLRGKD